MRELTNAIVNRLTGIQKEIKLNDNNQDNFLQESLSVADIAKLKLDVQLHAVINQRLEEIQITIKMEASLSTIFLCGSTLEGLLLDIASKNIIKFNKSKYSPKDRDGKVKQLHLWSLADLIETSYELGFISLDVKKHCHALRDFRNFIHPREQSIHQFNPDSHTAKISWQVLKAAIADLTRERMSHEKK